MPWRIVLGLHPSGRYGAFISKPNVDAMSADPTDTTAWALSTAWGRMASVIKAGTCSLNDDVYFPPGLGFAPLVDFAPISGNSIYPAEGVQLTNSAGNLRSGGTRFRIQQNGAVSFRIVKNIDFDSGSTRAFKYYVLSLPAT